MAAGQRLRPALWVYTLVVALAGWVALGLLLRGPAATHSPQEWGSLLTFALLSIGVKSLGFRVARDVTHSLVGIVDLAVLYTFGAPCAALVSLASSAACQALRGEADGSWRTAERWAPVVFVSGLGVLKVVAASWAYGAAGGTTPPAPMSWGALGPIVAASLTWFVVDHVGWGLSWLVVGGTAALTAFLRRILPYSLLIELLPLPVSSLIAAAYSAGDVLFLFVALTILGIGFVLQVLMVSLSKERRHVRELSTISELGQGLLSARLDAWAVGRRTLRSAVELTGAPVAVLRLTDVERGAPTTLVSMNGAEPTPADIPLTAEPLASVAAACRTLLMRDWAPGHPQPLEVGPRARSGLYVPILRGGAADSCESNLLGILALQSPARGGLREEDRDAIELLAAQAAMGLHTARLYEQERWRAAQLLTIAEVSRKVAAIQGLTELFQDTARLIADTFAYYHVGIFTVDQDARRVMFEAASSPDVQQRGLEVAWGAGIIGNAASTKRTIVANDVLADDRFLADTLLPDTRSEMAVPLAVEDRVVGIIDVQSNAPGAFGDNDRFVLETLAAQVAIAIEDSRLYQAQQEQAWVSTALQQVAEAVAYAASPEEALDAVARLAVMLAGVSRCAIYAWSPEEGVYSVVAAEGWSAPSGPALGARYSPAEAALLERVRMTDTVAVVDARETRLPGFGDGDGARDDERVIALPLHLKGEVTGVVVTAEPAGPDAPAEHHMTILGGIAHHAALGVESARLYLSQREEAWVTTALLQVASSIASNLNLDETVATVARLVPMLVGVDWSALLLWDEERQEVVARHGHGLDAEELQTLLDAPSSDATLCLRQIIARGEPLIAPSGPGEDGTATTAPPGSLAVFPLRARSRRLGVLVAGRRAQRTFSGRDVTILSGIASQAALAVEASQLYARTLRQQRLEREIELAREIQGTFLPEHCPQPAGWQLAVEWRAARGAAGDFYDFIHVDDEHLGLVIADVSDKGVAAALYMALSRTVLRAAALDAGGPAETLERANRVLLEDSRSGMFVTLFYAILEPATGRLRYARAGHNPPLWVRPGAGEVRELCPPGVVLGITDAPGIVEEEIVLAPGEALVMYTDGVTDSLDARGNEFGEERLRDVVSTRDACRAGDLVARVDAAVRAFTADEDPFDDLTLLVISRDAQVSRADGRQQKVSAAPDA